MAPEKEVEAEHHTEIIVEADITLEIAAEIDTMTTAIMIEVEVDPEDVEATATATNVKISMIVSPHQEEMDHPTSPNIKIEFAMEKCGDVSHVDSPMSGVMVNVSDVEKKDVRGKSHKPTEGHRSFSLWKRGPVKEKYVHLHVRYHPLSSE